MINNRKNAVDSRLTDLEIKISYTEDLVDELNRTIYRQQLQIDRLIAEFQILREQVRSAEPLEQRNLRDEIPPHY